MFQILGKALSFQYPALLSADESMVAIKGDLSPERLLLAYSMGIFPWYSEDETPII